jgi:polyisoprenoid-binding protein YceI
MVAEFPQVCGQKVCFDTKRERKTRPMMLPRIVSSLTLGLALAVSTVATAQTPGEGVVYQFDPAHTSINFGVRHLVINTVRGRFGQFAGTITYDAKDVTKSSVEFTAQVASITTDVEPRDKHLKSPDFFDAEKYPTLTFKSTKIEKQGDGFVAHGTLTIKAVAKEIAIPFKLGGPIKDPWGNDRIGVEGTVTINRQDYGIAYDQKLPDGGLAVANDVQITLDVEAVHKP